MPVRAVLIPRSRVCRAGVSASSPSPAGATPFRAADRGFRSLKVVSLRAAAHFSDHAQQRGSQPGRVGGPGTAPAPGNNRCGRWQDHRQVINGITHRLGTGCQWRELPERFGPWQTLHERQVLWSADSTWKKLLQHVRAVADAHGRHRLGVTPSRT
ncbi:transposase [Streptomyces kanasensis]|uniref:transposase n=1 Tax=Streptomyces kanasensis TaxID=936756 RepID=UPI0037F6C494